MDRVIRLTTFDEEQARNSALEYWLSRPPEESIAEVERLRREYFARLHGARRGLLPFLRLHEPVHVLHAHAGAGGQLPGDVRGLGRRGVMQLSADRLLLR